MTGSAQDTGRGWNRLAMPAGRPDGLFERTVDALLDAALDDARWSDAFRLIDRLCDLCGGQISALTVDAEGNLEATFGACYINGDPHQEIVADWVENFGGSGENVARIGKLPTWDLAHNEMLFTPAEKRTSLMYNEFQPKYDCQDQVGVVVDRPSGARHGRDFLMWTMRNDRSDWTSGRLGRIRSLLPHIRQAVRIRRELVAGEAHACADVSALLEDTIALGVVFLDRRGAIVSANRTARRLLRAGDGLYDRQGALRACSPRDDARLRRLVSKSLPRFGHMAVGGHVPARRPAGRPLIVHVHPVSPSRADFGAERLAAMVLIRDPDADRARRFDPEMVGDLLGLSKAESRVAALLGQGRSVRDIVRELDRSVHTVRWTVKQVLSKTRSARQVDLVRLLLQLPAGERGEYERDE